MKIINFADIKRNKSVFMQKGKKKNILKQSVLRNFNFKFIIRQLILNLSDFWQNYNVLAQNDQVFKKY